MDAAVLSAISALAGSLIGAASSVVTTWLTQRGQARAKARLQQIAKRELLYTEFIGEVAQRLTDGLGRNAESLKVVVRLYSGGTEDAPDLIARGGHRRRGSGQSCGREPPPPRS